VKIELTPEEKKLFARDRKVDREAFVEYTRARQYWDDMSAESLYKARSYLENAIAKDPEWAAPYASLAVVWGTLAQFNYEAPEVAGPMILGNLSRAMELDPDFPDSHFILGALAVWQEWNWEKGEAELLRAIAVNPNDAVSRAYYAHLLIILQRDAEAAKQARLAAELDPLNPLVLALCAVVLMDEGDHEGMREYTERALKIDPGHDFALSISGYVATYFRDCTDFIHSVRALQPLGEEAFTRIETACGTQGFDPAVEEYIHQMLLLEDKQGFVGQADLAAFYLHLNDLDKAVESLYKAFKMRDPNVPYIGTALFGSEKLSDRPDYLAILDSMNLPHPQRE
jgi:tetratricopeptide (TPR) repeat protein